MAIDSSPARRFEWKYRVPPELADELVTALESRTRSDAYCTGPHGSYPVRSLYFDTRDLRFYHEKKDGLRIRRKLRVRDYGTDQFFLEIKRKLDKKVMKERVSVPRSLLATALNGGDPAVLTAGWSDADSRILERFRFNLKSLGLVPTLLVTYERRALVGRADPHLRITLDHDLRGRLQPGADALFEQGELVAFEPRHVLELKFAGRPPRWLMDVVTRLHLRREPYSKYCEAIDRCANGAHAGRAGEAGEAPAA